MALRWFVALSARCLERIEYVDFERSQVGNVARTNGQRVRPRSRRNHRICVQSV
jgi:hypothetical protein